jgi:PAS domain S-box-containing protein
MTEKPTYEELEQRVKELEKETFNRKQTEDALRKSEERFRNMFEKHNAVMLIIEPDLGDILDANLAAERFYGYPIDRLRSMKITDINSLSSDQVAKERKRAASEKRNYFVFPHVLASGEERIVGVHSSPILLQERQVLFSIIYDITEAKRAEKALRESEERFRSIIEDTEAGYFETSIEN